MSQFDVIRFCAAIAEWVIWCSGGALAIFATAIASTTTVIIIN